jgi:integrase
VRDLLARIVERPAPIMANRVWALVNQIFNFAIEQDWLDTGNPATRITKQTETSRDRVLTEDELRALWTALESCKTVTHTGEPGTGPVISPMIARGLQVLLLTAHRPGEVFKMRWQDVDLNAKWWTIPVEHSKNGQPHRVALTDRALGLIKEARAASPKNNGRVFAGIAGGSVAARAKKAAAELERAGAIAFEFHRHDLRRTAATHMAAAGIARDTISHVLNHVDRGSRATAVYERFSHDPEKRVALEAWDRRFETILAAKPAATVLAFARA